MFIVIPLNNADSFLLQDNAIFLRLESLKEELVFHDLSYVLKQKEDIFLPFLAYKTLRAILHYFYQICSNHLFSDGTLTSS